MNYHRDPFSMAKSLATYIDDPNRIQSEVFSAFGIKLHMSTIKTLRHGFVYHKAQKKRIGSRPYDMSQNESDRKYREGMEAASQALALRIIEAREGRV